MKKYVFRLVEPLILGFMANYIFSSGDPGFSIIELIVAVILCAFITEINRLVEFRLEKKYKWTANAPKRFFLNLFYLVLSMLFVINVLGNLYIIVIGDTFYDWGSMLIINLVTFSVTLMLTTFKWASFFFKNWKHTETKLHDAKTNLDTLVSRIEGSEKSVKLYKNSKDYNISISEIRMAKTHHGLVKVVTDGNESFIYVKSLSSFLSLLPKDIFFNVNRNLIVHWKQVICMESAPYGKINVQISKPDGITDGVVVSRLKASSFRKWFNSISS